MFTGRIVVLELVVFLSGLMRFNCMLSVLIYVQHKSHKDYCYGFQNSTTNPNYTLPTGKCIVNYHPLQNLNWLWQTEQTFMVFRLRYIVGIKAKYISVNCKLVWAKDKSWSLIQKITSTKTKSYISEKTSIHHIKSLIKTWSTDITRNGIPMNLFKCDVVCYLDLHH